MVASTVARTSWAVRARAKRRELLTRELPLLAGGLAVLALAHPYCALAASVCALWSVLGGYAALSGVAAVSAARAHFAVGEPRSGLRALAPAA